MNINIFENIRANIYTNRFVHLKEIVGPQGLLSISRSAFYKGIAEGIYPKPTKLGRAAVWRLSEISAIIDAGSGTKIFQAGLQ
jgi:predicted DNA-binding transcriptional regulator AlpA